MIEAGSLNIATDTTLAILREIMRHNWLRPLAKWHGGVVHKARIAPEPLS